MEEISVANLDTNKLEAIAQEIYIDLTEDSCLGFCFEVHRAVKCGYSYLEFAEAGSLKDFGIQPAENKGACRLPLCSLQGEPGNGPDRQLQRSPPEFHPGQEELHSLRAMPCLLISKHTRMCSRFCSAPNARLFCLPDVKDFLDSLDIAVHQAIISGLQWDCSFDI
ncbi:Ataxin-7-like protein 3B [Plecturocebus cupreus]